MSFKLCSDRTKRRRVAAELDKLMNELEKDVADTECTSSINSDPLTDSLQNRHASDACNFDNTDDNLTLPGVDSSLLGHVDFFDEHSDDSSHLTGHIQCFDESAGDVTINDFDDIGGCSEDFDDCYNWNSRLQNDSDNDCDENDTECDDDDVPEQLAKWAADDNICHASVNRLLRILKTRIPELPTDARKLLQTSRNVVTPVVAGGEYYYFGIEYWLQILLSGSSSQALQNLTDHLHLHINVDGIPLFNSVNVALWPILGIVAEWKGSPFPIAIFCSKSKPTSVSEYLKDFIAEMNELSVNGFTFQGKHYCITLSAVICDAPARAFLKCVKLHGGYRSCERCVQTGEWYNKKVILSSVSAPLRTDAGFISQQDPKHHLSTSPLTQLQNFSPVTGVPLDYMHLVCLGVVRRQIHLWIAGPRECKLSQIQLCNLSEKFVQFRSYIPREFSRRPRALSEYKQWKATELRLFLLYTGPICLKEILTNEQYSNFLDLSVAVRLLLSPQLCMRYVDYAEQLLEYFVACFGHLYGKDQFVYNVHSLIHIADDVRHHGALDNVSSFPFESYLGKLKKLVRRPQNPCSQIVRRVMEGCCQPNIPSTDKDAEFKKPHTEGPLPVSYMNYLQYKQCYARDFFVSVASGDNCFIVDGKVGIIKNILHYQVDNSCDAVLVFDEFTHRESFFTNPLDSQLLSIFIVDKLCSVHTVIPLSHGITKCILLPYKSKFVAVPQMHFS